MDWQKDYKKKLVTSDEAAAVIKSGDTVGMPGGCSQPVDVVNALCKRKDELENVTLYSGISMYPYEVFKPEYKGHINFISLFVGPLERAFLKGGNVDPISYHFSHARAISFKADCNIFMCEVSEPDERGYMSFGPVGAYNNEIMMQIADIVIIQVNKQTPFVFGNQTVTHVSNVDYIVESDHPLPEIPEIPISDVEKKIGTLIAERIPDGATIQIGIGAVSDAVGNLLVDKKDLGVHTEMMTNCMMNLAKKGVITGSKKSFHPGKMVAAFAIGNKELYDFIDRNPVCEFCPVYYANDVNNIAKNDNMISINNTMTVDLTGQCASESLGFSMFSGTGGQLDFVRGATKSKGGMSFLALPSTVETKSGTLSRVVTQFKPGTIVTTPRSDVQYIVTEYGIADMWLKSVPQRIKEMISIAHPDFRDELEKEAREVGLLY
ncbi:MAG: 4-hydroxybutyrate CoA-transferase [Deltaproteobacteria bacterium]|uniref:4-hydroxybutyrate CoA-transferase n=1 Tax=Candidatus Zymogenus saltonus TaxID=2844893 RepID=A0A9D8PNW0_9DELT|nr:4-hydroxybutyrate CoA-transferase [Candidatus Zymogenus saltonus]